jgi:hypothetical protein
MVTPLVSSWLSAHPSLGGDCSRAIGPSIASMLTMFGGLKRSDAPWWSPVLSMSANAFATAKLVMLTSMFMECSFMGRVITSVCDCQIGDGARAFGHNGNVPVPPASPV